VYIKEKGVYKKEKAYIKVTILAFSKSLQGGLPIVFAAIQHLLGKNAEEMAK
jgi:hypothetical protein